MIFQVIRHQVPQRAVVLDDETGGRFTFGSIAGSDRCLAQHLVGRRKYVVDHLCAYKTAPHESQHTFVRALFDLRTF